MARATIEKLKKNRLAAMAADQRAVFDETYEAGRLALNVGEQVRGAREVAGLSQRELAVRMGTSEAASTSRRARPMLTGSDPTQ